MKLISCKIDGFGCLENRNLQFDEKLNSFCEANGTGKSTLAAFIRVMFYGFEGERSKKAEDREREQYRPWSAKIYGGQIRFQVKEKQYELYRTFGSKAKEDRFRLRDAVTNLESSDFTEDIGREVFGIDSDSFMRCAFIAQNHCETGTTDDINSKIGNLSDNTCDLNNYESIRDRLEDSINHLTPNRKTGLLARLNDEITGLKSAINDEKTLDGQIETVLSVRNREQRSLDELREKRKSIVELHSIVAAAADREHYEDICKSVREAKAALDQSASVFVNGVPSDGELKNAADAYAFYLKNAADAAERMPGAEASEKLSGLKEMFRSGFSAEECKTNMDKAVRINFLKSVTDSGKMSRKETEELSELSAFFGSRRDPSGELEEMRSLCREADRKRERLPEMENRRQEAEEKKAGLEAKRGPLRILTASGILLLAAGLACLFLQKAVPAAAAACVCAVLMILTGIIMSRNLREETEKAAGELEKTEAAVDAAESEIEYAKRTVSGYLSGFGFSAGTDVSLCFSEIFDRTIYYKQLLKKAEKSECEEEKAEIRVLAEELSAYLGRYGITEPFSFYDALEDLKESYVQYGLLAAQEKEYGKLMENAAKEKAAFEEFLRKYGIPDEGADGETVVKLRDGKSTAAQAQKTYELACGKKAEFEAEHDTDKMKALPAEENMPSLKELSEQIDAIDAAIDAKKNEIDGISKELNSLMERSDIRRENMEVLQEKSEEKADGTKKYERLIRMKEHLEKAKHALTAKYSGPVYRSFLRYLGFLLGDAGGYRLNADLKVSYEASGMPRSVQSLSTGGRDLVGFCLRLAFVDAMFEEEKPFLILDDPFVNLDRSRTEAGMKLIGEAAKKYQILYFTCHESRSCQKDCDL